MARQLIYIGTYTDNGSRGIYGLLLDPEKGTLRLQGLLAETNNPSFLCVSNNRLFAANEEESGTVTAFSIEPTSGVLTRLGSQPTGGNGPCYVSTTLDDRHLLVANYGSGSVALLAIGNGGELTGLQAWAQHTGKGLVAGRQDAPHAHSILPHPVSALAFACDLGTDRILVYPLTQANLDAWQPRAVYQLPAGSGPRHLCFSHDGSHFYVATELTNEVLHYTFDPVTLDAELQSRLKLIETEGKAAEILMHPSGKWLYVSARGPDLIIQVPLDADGAMGEARSFPSGGAGPRSFGMSRDGQWLLSANQSSGNVVLYRIGQESGFLTDMGQQVAVPKPVSVRFLD